ncbi:MAG: hypothetical protein GYB65_06675 [Chloroflexi bacterium]|nr:hypothetical protein [Chloroflexota bacterium]
MTRRIRIFVVAVVVLATAGFAVVLAQGPDSAPPIGDVLLLHGRVLDENGAPLAGAAVEIWQTDANGLYKHPNDNDGSALLDDFQYFGTSVTNTDGLYSFRTIRPAPYAPRPSHIHVKVRYEGRTVLITQFYFADEAPGVPADLLLRTVEGFDQDGAPVLRAGGDLVVVLGAGGGSGSLVPTSAQAEGPYYPVVDVGNYDSDLTVTGMQGAVELSAFTLLNLNTATADEFQTIPGVDEQLAQVIVAARPYTSFEQFYSEIDAVAPGQLAAISFYAYIPVDANTADAATLMQLPGVDEQVATDMIAARPYDSNAAFLTALGQYLSPTEVAFAGFYLLAD